MKNPIKAAEIAARNAGVVPYERQTPQQRKEMIGRIKLLLCTRVLSEMLRENFKYIVGSVPENPTDINNKRLRQKLSKAKQEIADIIPKVKGLDSLFTSLVAAHESAADQFDEAGIFAYRFIENIHSVSLDKMELLVEVTQAIIDGRITELKSHENIQIKQAETD